MVLNLAYAFNVRRHVIHRSANHPNRSNYNATRSILSYVSNTLKRMQLTAIGTKPCPEHRATKFSRGSTASADSFHFRSICQKQFTRRLNVGTWKNHKIRRVSSVTTDLFVNARRAAFTKVKTVLLKIFLAKRTLT